MSAQLRILLVRLYSLSRFLCSQFLDTIRLLKHSIFSTSEVARALATRGYYIYNQPIDRALIGLLLEDCDSKLKLTSVTHGQANRRYQVSGLITNLLQPLLDNIRPDLVASIGSNYSIEISYYQKSVLESSLEDVPGGYFHVDDNRLNIKLFIYLTNVSSDNGPFQVIPRNKVSLHFAARFIRGLLWELTKKRKYLYSFLVPHVHLPLYAYSFLGQAGTYFLVDTTCLHRDSAVVNSYRKVAVVSFNLPRIF